VYVDTTEGVEPPGIKAVTGVRTRVPGTGLNSGDDATGAQFYPEPLILEGDDFVPDFASDTNRGSVTNCMLASNPTTFCDSAAGSGKRVKMYLTSGLAPLDLRLRTTPNDDFKRVEYFTFGRMLNFSGARIVGYNVELRDAAGNLMQEEAGRGESETAVLFDLGNTGMGIGSRLTDGLLGAGGQEGDIGFFSSAPAGFTPGSQAGLTTEQVNTLEFGAITNAFHVANFGDAWLDDSMVPDGFFWDDTADPDDEDSLVAWNDLRPNAGWTYGILGAPETIDARLDELAAALGVPTDALGYSAGAQVPAEIIAAMQAKEKFEVDLIEDLRNANLNFSVAVGNIEEGEFTLRMAPRYADIVEQATTETQFRTAGYLDGVANVPYLDIGNAAEYQSAIAEMLALDEAGQAEALERVGFTYLGAFSGLGLNIGRDQVFALGRPTVEVGARVSSMGSNGWAMGDNLRGFASIQGSSSEYEATANNSGYDVKTTSFSAGVEAAISPSASFGVMVGGVDGKADAFAGRGSVDASGWSLAAFGRTSFGQGGSLQGIIGYQDLSFDTSRNAFGGAVAKGAADGSQTFMALQADYMFRQGALTWGPMASVERYKMSVDGFNETGAGAWNLAVGAQGGWTTLASAGVRGEYMVDPAGSTRAYGSLAMTKSSGDDQIISTGFVGLSSGLAPVDAIDENWVDLNLGMSTVIAQSAGKQTLLGAEYRGAYGSSYKSHGLGVFVKMKF
jgi:uncharacterized protein YhjY with autotransporter beta-barrel domain